jgi:hypothetical protein
MKDKIQFQDDGTPNWTSLKTYCHNLLEEIVEEVYTENEAS